MHRSKEKYTNIKKRKNRGLGYYMAVVQSTLDGTNTFTVL